MPRPDLVRRAVRSAAAWYAGRARARGEHLDRRRRARPVQLGREQVGQHVRRTVRVGLDEHDRARQRAGGRARRRPPPGQVQRAPREAAGGQRRRAPPHARRPARPPASNRCAVPSSAAAGASSGLDVQVGVRRPGRRHERAARSVGGNTTRSAASAAVASSTAWSSSPTASSSAPRPAGRRRAARPGPAAGRGPAGRRRRSPCVPGTPARTVQGGGTTRGLAHRDLLGGGPPRALGRGSGDVARRVTGSSSDQRPAVTRSGDRRQSRVEPASAARW